MVRYGVLRVWMEWDRAIEIRLVAIRKRKTLSIMGWVMEEMDGWDASLAGYTHGLA